MIISIFGLGYVGSVGLGCLAQAGHEVIGVDVSPAKVDCINAGRSPIVEAGLDRVIADQRAAGRISATTDLESRRQPLGGVLHLRRHPLDRPRASESRRHLPGRP